MTPVRWFEYIAATGMGVATCALIAGVGALVYFFFAGLLSKRP